MPHPVDVYVGKRLRMRRTILGMSQDAIGSAIGVTFQQVQKYERGVNRMGASRLFDFSRLLNVPVAYFFDGYDIAGSAGAAGAGAAVASFDYGFAENEAAEFEHENLTSRETLEMMRAYYRITDPQVRKRVCDLVKSLADKPEVVN